MKLSDAVGLTFSLLRKILVDPVGVVSFLNAPIRNSIIQSRSRATKDFFFIQIGAHNGVDHDFLRKHIVANQWHGILVEPQKALYEELVQNYRTYENVSFEQCAVHDFDGMTTLHVSKDSGLSSLYSDDWFRSRNGGFAYANRKRHGESSEQQVPCMRLDTLLSKHRISKIDLLQIDTEGYDKEIIGMINFSTHRPGIISFEDHHLSKSERCDVYALLRKNGYRILRVGSDTLAY